MIYQLEIIINSASFIRHLSSLTNDSLLSMKQSGPEFSLEIDLYCMFVINYPLEITMK